jgi:hypothetical protein
LDHQSLRLVVAGVLLVQVQLQIQEILVVLAVVEHIIHLLAVQLLVLHSQELLEQHQHLVGVILEEVQLVPKVLVAVVVPAEQVLMTLAMAREVLAFNFQQHLEIHPL